MKFAKISLFAIFLSVSFMTSACQVTVHERDERTIENFEDSKKDFTKCIARAAGIEAPADDIVLKEEQFPIGKLTWDEYDSVLGEYDSKIFLEKQKKAKESATGN